MTSPEMFQKLPKKTLINEAMYLPDSQIISVKFQKEHDSLNFLFLLTQIHNLSEDYQGNAQIFILLLEGL